MSESRSAAPAVETEGGVRPVDGSRGPIEVGDPALPAEPAVHEAIEVAPPETAHEEARKDVPEGRVLAECREEQQRARE